MVVLNAHRKKKRGQYGMLQFFSACAYIYMCVCVRESDESSYLAVGSCRIEEKPFEISATHSRVRLQATHNFRRRARCTGVEYHERCVYICDT